MSGSVIVVGSANLDLVYRVAAHPAPGETVLATATERHPGGKGNNQVIAAARAGADSTFVASIGADANGDELSATLEENGVTAMLRRPPTRTGTALITVDERGENTIVVDSGANAELLDLTDDELSVIAAADVLLLQLEVPIATVQLAAAAAKEAGTTVVLNAAPFRPLGAELLDLVDVLVVNEVEAAALGDDAAAMSSVVVTRGEAGAVVRRGADEVVVPAPVVESVVDTTGAGDAFCGALAAALAEGRDLTVAARFGACAGALAVQHRGAVPSLPTRTEIDAQTRRP